MSSKEADKYVAETFQSYTTGKEGFTEDYYQTMKEECKEAYDAGDREGYLRALDTAVKGIENEPTFPGEMPDEIFKAIRNDKDAISNALRIAVKQTKENIINQLRDKK